MSQVRYVRGGHGAVLQEVHWEEIARFIADGEVPAATAQLFPRAAVLGAVGGECLLGLRILLPFLLVLLAWLPFQTTHYIMNILGYNNIYALAVSRPSCLWGTPCWSSGSSRGSETRHVHIGVPIAVPRGKARIFSGCNSRPDNWSLHPVAIGATAEVTKPSKPSRQRAA